MVGNPTHPLAHIRGPNIHFYQCWSKSISRFSSSSPSSSPATCKIFPNLSKTYLMLCITFPGKSHFTGSCIFWEVIFFPGKSHFPRSFIFREVKLLRKSHCPGSYILREDTFPGKIHFPGSHISQ